MKKSELFILFSLVFLITTFIIVIKKPIIFGNSLELSFFEYDKYYTFTGQIIKKEKKIKGNRYLVLSEFGKILISTPLYPEYNLNDNLEISCKLKKAEPIIDDYGYQFFYDKYLAKDNIFILCSYPQIKFLNNNNYNILSIKEYFSSNLNNYLREPASSLAKAMLLAERRELNLELRTAFSKTGLSHIIAISGLHIAIIVYLLQILLISLNKRISFFLI